MTESPFNIDPQLTAMKENIASRTQKLQWWRFFGTAVSVAGAAAAMFLLPPGVGQIVAVVAMGISSVLVPLVTTKEIERLNIDRQYLETRMQGGNWGEGHWRGYRREVAEYGHAAPQVALQDIPSRNGPARTR